MPGSNDLLAVLLSTDRAVMKSLEHLTWSMSLASRAYQTDGVTMFSLALAVLLCVSKVCYVEVQLGTCACRSVPALACGSSCNARLAVF